MNDTEDNVSSQLDPKKQLVNDTLLYAVQTNKPFLVEKAIAEGADLNSVCKVTKQTPLGAAFELEHLDIYRLLLKHGADAKLFFNNLICDDSFASYKRYAKVQKCVALLTILFDHGVEPAVDVDWVAWADFIDELTGNFYFKKEGDGYVAFVKTLLEFNMVNTEIKEKTFDLEGHSFKSNCRGDLRHVLLFNAVLAGCLELVDWLIARGVPVNIVNSYRDTLLHAASSQNNVDILDLLFEKGALYINGKGFSPIDVAFKSCCNDVVKYFVSKGYKSLQGERYRLHYACMLGDEAMVKKVIGEGVDLNELMEYKKTGLGDGKSALRLCVQFKNLTLVKLLVEAGADIALKVPRHLGKYTNMLKYAAYCNNAEALEYLLDVYCKGKALSKCDPKSYELLMDAADTGSLETFKVLLERGARIEAPKGEAGPLCFAAEGGHAEMVRLLLEKGVDVNKNSAEKDESGGDSDDDENSFDQPRRYHDMRPLVCCQDPKCIRLLLEHGADIHSLGYLDKVRKFIKDMEHIWGQKNKLPIEEVGKGLGVDFGSNEESVPPYLTVMRTGSLEAVKAFFDIHGKDVRKDSMVFNLACLVGQLDIVEFLVRANPSWLQELIHVAPLIKQCGDGFMEDMYDGIEYQRCRYLKMLGRLLDLGCTVKLHHEEPSMFIGPEEEARRLLRLAYTNQRYVCTKLLQEWCGRCFTFNMYCVEYIDYDNEVPNPYDPKILLHLLCCGHKLKMEAASKDPKAHSALESIGHALPVSLQSLCRVRIRKELFDDMTEYVHINQLLEKLPVPKTLIEFLSFSGPYEASYLRHS